MPEAPSLEERIEQLKEIVERYGKVPSPAQDPEFWEIMDEVYVAGIRTKQLTWGDLAQQLGVSEGTLKGYYNAWKKQYRGSVGTLSPQLVKVVTEQLRKYFGKQIDRVTAEFISSVIEYGLIVKNNFEPFILAAGRDVKSELAKALDMYIEYGDRLPGMLEELDKLRKVVKVQQATIVELESSMIYTADKMVRQEVAKA